MLIIYLSMWISIRPIMAIMSIQFIIFERRLVREHNIIEEIRQL